MESFGPVFRRGSSFCLKGRSEGVAVSKVSITIIRENQLHNIDRLKARRKQFRSNLTPAEAYLWNYLKNSKLEGRKFRRQHSFGKYIMDFYCFTQKLVVELDGMYHFTEEQMKYNAERTEYLDSMGIRVIRFENAEVFEKTEEVLFKLKECFKGNHPVTS